VGDEIEIVPLVSADHHHILPDASGWSSGNVAQLKNVAMQMDGMDIIARVAHADAVALALPQMKHGGPRPAEHFAHGESDAVDRPTIEAGIGSVFLDESRIEGFVGRGRPGARLGEL